MAYTARRIGTNGMFLSMHGVEPSGRAMVLSQDRMPVFLLMPEGLR